MPSQQSAHREPAATGIASAAAADAEPAATGIASAAAADAEPAVTEMASAETANPAAETEAAQGDAFTGQQAVDEAVRAVANASGLPVSEQLAAYEGAHQTLREVLASIEE